MAPLLADIAIRTILASQELAGFVAEVVLADLQAALAARGRGLLVLAGGSTFKEAYRLLAERSRELDWSKVTIVFGDERCVAPDSPDSNFHMASETLLGAIQPAAVLRMEGELPPAEGAVRYAEALRELGGGELPVFDLVLLGMGPDGHVASIFAPSLQSALHSPDLVVVTEPEVTSPPVTRLSLTLPVLNSSRHTLLVAAGEGKASAVAELCGDAAEPYPAAYVRASQGKTELILDTAAAATISPEPA